MFLVSLIINNLINKIKKLTSGRYLKSAKFHQIHVYDAKIMHKRYKRQNFRRLRNRFFVDFSFPAPTASILGRRSSFLRGFIAEIEGYRSAQKRVRSDK